jgi:hypothetical protein
MKEKRNYLGKILKLSVVILLLSSNSIIFAQKYDQSKVGEAISYNDMLIDEESKVMNSINELDAAIAGYDPATIESAINNSRAVITVCMAVVKNSKPFYGDKTFKDATIALFTFFLKQIDNEYSDILKYYRLSDTEYTTKEEAIVNGLLKKIDADYLTDFTKFTDVQHAFAQKFGYTISSN